MLDFAFCLGSDCGFTPVSIPEYALNQCTGGPTIAIGIAQFSGIPHDVWITFQIKRYRRFGTAGRGINLEYRLASMLEVDSAIQAAPRLVRVAVIILDNRSVFSTCGLETRDRARFKLAWPISRHWTR